MRLALSGEAGLLLLAWVLARWLGLAPLSQLRPSLESLVWGVGATVPLLAALAVIMRVRSGPLHQLVSLLVDRLGPLLGA